MVNKGLPEFAFSPSLGRRVKPDDPDWPPKVRHWACRPCPSARFENETWPNMLAKWNESNEIYDADQREIAEYVEHD